MATATFRSPDSTTDKQADTQYSKSVNPYWVRLLKLLQMNVAYKRCVGAELFTVDGRVILDCLSGYCVHNLRHNHPAIIAAIKDELDRLGPAMLQSHVPERAGDLAAELCRLAGGDVRKVFFCSSGSEGVEAAIKFSRKYTKRTGLIYADGAFHGLTCGALSIRVVSFGGRALGRCWPIHTPSHLATLQRYRKLKTKQMAAFIVEPIQGEAGIRKPPQSYLQEARKLCSQYGTLLVFDEVQTGFCRTGPFLAAHHDNVSADMIVLAKSMSGGLIPSGALLTTDPIYDSLYGSLKRSLIHTSTYSENGLAMRVGLAVLETLERERIEEQATENGEDLRKRLREELVGFEMVDEVRGAGLFNGLAFKAPKKLPLRASFEAFTRIHPAMFGQVLVMRLLRDHGVLTQLCGNNFMVVKVAQPLITTREQLDRFVSAIRGVVLLAHTTAEFWTEALHLAMRSQCLVS